MLERSQELSQFAGDDLVGRGGGRNRLPGGGEAGGVNERLQSLALHAVCRPDRLGGEFDMGAGKPQQDRQRQRNGEVEVQGNAGAAAAQDRASWDDLKRIAARSGVAWMSWLRGSPARENASTKRRRSARALPAASLGRPVLARRAFRPGKRTGGLLDNFSAAPGCPGGLTTCPCSASKPRAPACPWPRPFAGVRWKYCRENERRPCGHPAAAD
jgi:hypothetical protein